MKYKYNSELSNDDSKLQNSIFWKRKEQFALLMENLVTDFSLLWWESMEEDATLAKDSKRGKNFHLNPKSYGFCSLVTSVFRQFEVLEDEECTEQEVKDYV